MLCWLFNLCYGVLALLVLPVGVWKRLRTGKYRLGWNQKLWGSLPARTDLERPLIWLHAVSVGEVLQLRQIVDRMRRDRPEVQILITTTTETGYAVAREKLADCTVAFFPLDFSWSVRRALRRVCPDLVVLVELELWPNFILESAKLQIPLALINGRLSENSFQGYSRIRPLVRRLLQSFSVIGVQSSEYRRRFLELGANPETTITTGSIKFDGVSTDSGHPRTQALAEWLHLAPGALVFVAGSTQAPEEQYALDAYTAILPLFPQLRLVLVPRHPERRQEMAELIQRHGYSVRQRSTDKTIAGTRGNAAVGLLDTVGELGACWALADVAFVGGSFTSRGGQNMLEPSAFGAAVCFGPNTWNFKQIVAMLLEQQAACVVSSTDELRQFVQRMLQDQSAAVAMGARARDLVLSQQGATDRTIQLLWRCPLRSGTMLPSRAA